MVTNEKVKQHLYFGGKWNCCHPQHTKPPITSIFFLFGTLYVVKPLRYSLLYAHEPLSLSPSTLKVEDQTETQNQANMNTVKKQVHK